VSGSVSIHYGAIAPGAKENFYPSASEKESFVDISELQGSGLEFPNYLNPCELNSFLLDGKSDIIPQNTATVNLGLWSVQTSGEDGRFPSPIVLTAEASGQYSSQGITLTFDEQNGIFSNDLTIDWYRSGTLIQSANFSPNSASFFCQKTVSNYDKIVVTFRSLNVPFQRLKLHALDYGYGRIFSGKELKNVSLIQQVDPISSEISINTCDFTLDSKSDIDLFFQTKQPLKVYFNGELKASMFIYDSSRLSKSVWKIQSEDYIGLLDSIPFYGGIYKNKSVEDLLEEIFSVAKVPFDIDSALDGYLVNGYIPYTTCRDALMQACFASMAIADTSNSDVIKVYRLSEEVTQTIPTSRIMQGQTFEKKTVVTSVELDAHTYKESQEEASLYSADDSGTGNNIFITFSEPIHSLSISNGTIVSRGTNYAVINANAGCVLSGKKYEHKTITKRKENPLVLASDIENVVSIKDATLVSSANIDDVLSRCYNYIANTSSANMKIVEGRGGSPVSVGDTIKFETEYLGDLSGVVCKQSFNLAGGIIVKNTTVKHG
jgi:hypothetical protein